MTETKPFGPGHPGYERWRADRASREGPRKSSWVQMALLLLALYVALQAVGR